MYLSNQGFIFRWNWSQVSNRKLISGVIRLLHSFFGSPEKLFFYISILMLTDWPFIDTYLEIPKRNLRESVGVEKKVDKFLEKTRLLHLKVPTIMKKWQHNIYKRFMTELLMRFLFIIQNVLPKLMTSPNKHLQKPWKLE